MHSVRLDDLYLTLDMAAGNVSWEIKAMEAIADLTPAERTEARKSPLIQAKIDACRLAPEQIRSMLD